MSKRVGDFDYLVATACITAGVWLLVGMAWGLIAFGALLIIGGWVA